MRPSAFFRGAAASLIVSAALATPVAAFALEPAITSTGQAVTSSNTSEVAASEKTTQEGAVQPTQASVTDGATSRASANASEKSQTQTAATSTQATADSSQQTAATTQDDSSKPQDATESSGEESLDGKSYVIQNDHNGTRGVMDVNCGSKSNEANVQLYESNGTAAQRWRFRGNGDGSYTILNQGSGKALDVAYGNAKSGGNVWQYDANGSDAQRWVIKWVDHSKGLANILLAAHPELALDAYSGSTANGTNLQVWTANGSAAQIWRLRDIIEAEVDAIQRATGLDVVESLDGQDFKIVSKADGKSLAVSGGSKSVGAGLVFESGGGSASQAYRLTREGGYWRIRNVRSGLSVAVVNGDIVPGAAIRQEASVTDDSQLWTLYRSNDGYGFVNKKTGLVFSNVSDLFSGITMGSAGEKDELFSLESWAPSVAEGTYRITSQLGNGQNLDVSCGSTYGGANVQDYAWNGSMAQKWYVRNTGNGYAITNLGSGLRLSVSGNNVVQQGHDHVWGLAYVLGRGLSLVDQASGKVLDVYGANRSSGANVQVYTPNGTDAQVWNFAAVNPLEDGWYTIRTGMGSGRALDVAGASAYDGANVRLWDSNGSDAQRWYIFGVGNGYYTFVNGASNKVLDVQGGGGTGANVQQYTGNGTNAQHWRFTLKDGLFTFVNANGMVLDVYGGADSNGANVQIWDSNGTNAQRWLLSNTSVSNKMSRLVRFQNNMLAMANNNRHGYDQAYRWGERGDYDCSSLVISCLRWAGFSTGSATTTFDLRRNLQARGWQWITNINPWEAQPGDIMLSELHHVAAMVTHSSMVEARGNEFNGAMGGRPGDQTGWEICVSPWRRQRGLHTNQSWDGILRFTGWC